jgi:multiple sugar transport system ATP-binding protein
MAPSRSHLSEADRPDGNIRLKDVTKDFRTGQPAVNRLNLEISDRELLVLLGPSGCGKSTTLYMLAGLEVPTSGDIYFGDRLMNNVPPEVRDISMVFQSFGLYPHLNARQNIEFPLRLSKVAPRVVQSRVAEISEMLDIDHLLGRRLHELSGGERQRVAICKALVRRPRLFLLDEPFSSLDAEMRRQLRGELVRIHRQLETTMVFVTHDQEEAMAVADRVAVMRGGELVQTGDPLDMYNRPRNKWVARFIGAHPINLLDCVVDVEEHGLRPTANQEILFRVPSFFYETLRRRTGAQDVILGVRPEFVDIETSSTDGAQFRAEVFTRQVLGSGILYELSVGSGIVRSVVPATKNYRAGTQVFVGFDWDHVLLFDKTSELCLLD